MNVTWLLISVFNAIFVSLVFYLVITYLEGAIGFDLKKKGKLINDKVVVIIGIITLITTGVITYFRFPNMILEMKILTNIFICVMASLSVCDIKKTVVPNRVIFTSLFIWMLVISVSIIFNTSQGVALLGKSLIGGVISGVIFLFCYLVTKKKLGAGDVKLAFILGLYMTSERMFGGIFYGSILCCLFSIVQIMRKKLSFKSGVPMVPFLYMGCLITYLIL